MLLLYDPTRGVDVGTKGEIFQLMRDLAAKGYAILFHSSDMPELVHVADRVLVLRNGRIAATLEGDRYHRGAYPGRGDARRRGRLKSMAVSAVQAPIDAKSTALVRETGGAGRSTARRSSSPA